MEDRGRHGPLRREPPRPRITNMTNTLKHLRESAKSADRHLSARRSMLAIVLMFALLALVILTSWLLDPETASGAGISPSLRRGRPVSDGRAAGVETASAAHSRQARDVAPAGGARTRAAAPGCFPRPVTMTVTAYCPCRKCCGPAARGVTASGEPVSHNRGRFVAADRSIPFGTRISIPGYHGGIAVPVTDRGGAITGRRLDVYFPTHAAARAWGVRRVVVKIGGR
jgi:3D (Asp-Asp-Asp) domain-containing protein